MKSPVKMIVGVLVTLHVNGVQKLFLMLTADGAIRRSGDGSTNCNDTSLYIGHGSVDIFNKVILLSNGVIEKWLGSYADPEWQGDLCRLVIGFKDRGGGELLSEWEYGTESQGPPPEVSGFVVNAVGFTDYWYQSQKEASVRSS